jgi:hypothetical protein
MLAPAAADSRAGTAKTVADSIAPKDAAPASAAPIPAKKKVIAPTTGKTQAATPPKSTRSTSKKRRLCWQDGKLEVCGK